MDKKKAKALKAKRSPATASEDAALMDMLNEDRVVDPNSPYQLDNEMIGVVNKLTESGKPLRNQNHTMSEEEQRAADKKAYMLGEKKRRAQKTAQGN